MDETALVSAARSDPRRGFAAIYDRYGDRIHDYCLAVLRHRDDAADAAQDTFVIAYERLGQLRDPAKLTSWLYAIARSRCLRRIAERRRQRPTDDLEPLSPPEASASGEVERAELRRLVWEAAAGLAADDRAVLDLHLRQGLSGADLADALGVPAEKANLMLHRMKQRMGRTIGAVLVARTGRGDCPDLAAIATGELTPLLRKRLARHIERCQVCLRRRERLAPELLYAAVPLVPAPLVVGERFLAHTAPGTTTDLSTTDLSTTDLSGQMRWRPDGFPRPAGSAGPLPVPQRAVLAAGIATLVVLGLLGGLVAGRTIAGDDPSRPPAAAATASAEPAASLAAGAGATTPTAGQAPGGGLPSPGPGGGPTPTVAATATASTDPGQADFAAPTLSPLRLGDCGRTVTAEVDVLDTVDPGPTADLLLSWDAGPGSPVPMAHAGGNTYRAVVEREGAATGFITFTASGTVSDAAGNSALRTVMDDCTQIVD